MAAYLWFLGNTVWKETGQEILPTRLFYLNKILHGLDLYFKVPMPNIFLLSHPVGTVIGNASFSDFLMVSQNCTIGAKTTVYPTFDQGVALNANVSVIGDCRIGRSVVFGAGASIIDRCVPANSLVLGQFPNNRVIPRDLAVSDRYFKQVV